MTLGSFVVRNTFRNKRRSLLTMVSISFSLLLLTHDDLHLALVLHRPGCARSGAATDHSRSRFTGILPARVLPGEDSGACRESMRWLR